VDGRDAERALEHSCSGSGFASGTLGLKASGTGPGGKTEFGWPLLFTGSGCHDAGLWHQSWVGTHWRSGANDAM
jgi:hypothetical protein